MKKYFKQINFVFFSMLALGAAFFIKENHKDITHATKIDKAYADAPYFPPAEGRGDGMGDGV
jgi:hypothetical protein